MRREQGRLREERGLNRIALHQALVERALQSGFNRAAVVDPRLLPLPTSPGRGAPGEPEKPAEPGGAAPAGIEWPWVTEPAGWSSSSTILVCCLSCLRDEPGDPSTPGDPHALVAPFARAHYYRAAVSMLRRVAEWLESEAGVPRAGARLFSNSRIPEKPLLVAAGLGSYGRNGCAIVPGLGSLFVIAGAVFPFRTEWDDIPPAVMQGDPCESCRRCRGACPTHAIDEPYVVRHDRCLQAMASSSGGIGAEWREAWGSRLYGCQECQSACPHNAGLKETAAPAAGEIGPGVSLREYLSEDVDHRRKRFRGTALGMSWISQDVLLANALIAAGNRGDVSLRAPVERHAACGTELVRAAAHWALERLRGEATAGSSTL